LAATVSKGSDPNAEASRQAAEDQGWRSCLNLDR
jgi:hypothetical protein